MDEIKTIEELGRAFEQFKEVNEKLEKQVEEKGAELGQTREHLERLNGQIEELQVKLKRPAQHGADGHELSQDDAKRKSAFWDFARKGDRMSPESAKALQTDKDPNGGYVMNPATRKPLVRKLIEMSPIRQLATVYSISTGDAVEIPVEGSTDFSASWVGERGSRSETTAGTFKMEVVPTHEMYANPFVTQKMIDDAQFDMEAYVMDRLGIRFGVSEGTAFVTGSGVNQPEGILTDSNVTSVNSGAASDLTADGLIQLYYEGVADPYAKNGSWLAKRATVGRIRRLKDGAGQYLWQPGLAQGSPDMILGRPVYEAVDMPAIASDAYPVVFGDIRAGYVIVDRTDIRLNRDPYTNKPNVEMYTTKRVGGQVVLAEAIAKQKCST